MPDHPGEVITEAARSTAEEIRRLAEDAREVREQHRQALELVREERERLRAAAETAREAGEEVRAAAEGARQAAMVAVRATADILKATLEHMETVERLRRTLRDAQDIGNPNAN